MSDLSQLLLKQVIDHFDAGIVITENHASDWSICYVNSTFTEMTGYNEEEVLGKNPRFLQGDDEKQSGLTELHAALNQNTSCTVTLRNFSKDGQAFWNRLTVRPLLSKKGEITHYVGIMKNLGNISAQEIENSRQKAGQAISFRDQQTGLYNQEFFETQLLRDWHISMREKRELTVALFTPDYFDIYTTTFGPAAAESALRKVAYIINSTLKRASDTVARYQDNSIITLMLGDYADDNKLHLDQICDKIRDLCIHHPHSPDEKFLTVSLTAVSVKPDKDKIAGDLLREVKRMHNSVDESSNSRQFVDYESLD
jgi:diguanylate cyclase (GGDEF)-like protein/PAS domain S-box-containing protein